MRTTLTLALLLALGAPAAAQDIVRHAREEAIRIRSVLRHVADDAQRNRASRQEGPSQTERINRTLRIGTNGELDVANISGDITITRGSGSDVIVEAIKTARGESDEDARELLQLVQVEFVERSNRAEVRTRYPEGEERRRNNRRNISVNVTFNISVPVNTRVRAHSISGSVSAREVKGDLSLESVSGAVRIASGGRVSSGKSISGDVEVTDTSVEGMLQASTVSGEVILRRIKAGQLEAGSISGSVVVDDVECPRLEAQTVSGDVRFSGALTRNSRFELTSHSGNITIAITGGVGFEVEGNSFSGSIRSDFPLTLQGSDSRRPNRTIRGVYGDGSAVLDLTTFSGNIVISKR